MELIYLDHNSTTPLLPEVQAAMAPWQTSLFGNPSSQHQQGRQARHALEHAREEIGRILGAQLSGREPDRIIFTSGGTEANNLALLGTAGLHDPNSTPGEAIVSAIEHPSVAACAGVLERRGWSIHRLKVASDGVVDVEQLDEMFNERTRFVSVMLANNETGVLQPVQEIAARCALRGVPMHTDAAQMAGKLSVDFRALGANSLSVAAHKFHGPIGIGALIARPDRLPEPLLFGGFQQAGLRPGTESVALAVGMHAALAAWEREAGERTARILGLRDRLETALADRYAGKIIINGCKAERLPQTANVAFVGLDRQALLMALDLSGVACSAGSACASGSSEPSPVLTAMACGKEVLDSSLRFSLGASTTADEIEQAVERILTVCAKIATNRPRAHFKVR